MGIIHINQFGGLKLGMAKRDLPMDAGQQVDNLSPLVQTFTPLQEDGAPEALEISDAGPVKSMVRYKTDTKTLFGMTKAMNVARALVPDTDGSSAPKQRIYVTGDGTATSKPSVFWRENDYGAGRSLGVPPPTAKLKLTVVKKDPLTTNNIGTAFDAVAYELWTGMEKLLVAQWQGQHASAARPGYLDCHTSGTAGYHLGMAGEGDKAYQARVFGISPDGGIEPFLPGDLTQARLLLADLVNVPWVSAALPSSNLWGHALKNTSGSAIVFKAFYPTYTFARTGAVWDGLLAITKPGLPDETLLSAAELNAMLDKAAQKFDPAQNSDLAQAIANMGFRYALLTNMLDGKVGEVALGNVGAILNGATATARINQAYTAFANTVYDLMQAAVGAVADPAKTLVVGADALTLYSSDRAASVAAIIAAVKQELTGGVGQITTQPIFSAKTVLDAQKRVLYKAASATEAGKQAAVYQAALGIDFTTALRSIYNATIPEAFADLVDTGAGMVTDAGGRLSAAAVMGAIGLLDTAYENVMNVYAEAIGGARSAALEYLTGIQAVERHGDLSGVELTETRAYTWTLVNDWGEESMPYLPGNGNSDAEFELLELDGNDEVLVQATMPTPQEIMDYGYAKWRLYRSNSGSQASAFQLVFEKALTDNPVTDKKSNAALLESLASMTWEPPPVVNGKYLQGICALPNGFMAGFIDKTVYFSEVFRPYAWPSEYTHTFQYPIVGLGVFGQTLVVLTETGPWYLSGSDPSSMSKEDTRSNQACVSARSICPVDGGVIFASPDGLCLASPTGIKVFLPAPTGKVAWADIDLIHVRDMQCAEHDGVLYFLYGHPEANGAMWLSAMHLQTGKLVNVSLGNANPPVRELSAIYADRSTDTLYGVLASTRQAVKLFTDTTRRRLASFRSKRLTLETYTGFGWLRVLGEQSATEPATVRVFGYAIRPDGTEVEVALTPAVGHYTVTNTLPVRMPAGRYLEYEVQVQSRARITGVTLASSTAELQAVP